MNVNGATSRKNSVMSDYDECSICYDETKESPMVITRCRHTFHEDCITTWLNSKPLEEKLCVYCRQKPLPLVYATQPLVEKKGKSSYVESPVMNAVKEGNLTALEAIFQSNPASMNKLSKSFITGVMRTPLNMAAAYGQIEVVEFLLSKNIDINSQDSLGETALMCAVMSNQAEMVDLLLQKGADVNKQDKKGKTVIHKAARTGDFDVLKKLHENHGANLLINAYDSYTPLMASCEFGSVEIAEYLLEKGVKIDKRTLMRNISALYIASQNDNFPLVQLLLNKSADPNKNASKNRSALSVACHNSNIQIVQLLLDKGANVNCQRKDGVTPLYWAARNGNKELVELLLAKGADKRLRYKYAFWDRGETPKEAAVRCHHAAVADLL